MDRKGNEDRDAPLSDVETPTEPAAITGEIREAFERLARSDFSVRLPRTERRDTADVLAYFVNLIAENAGHVVAAAAATRQRLEEGVVELNELLLRFAAGDFSVRSKRTGEGDPLDVLRYLFDNTVSEVGAAFDEVERQRATLEAIFDSNNDGVLLLDPGGQIERANYAASRLFGRAVQELEGSPFVDLLAARDQSFGSSLGDPSTIQSFRSRDTYFVNPRGETFFLVLSGSPLADATGKHEGLVVTARDERELRRAQAQLQVSDRMATMGTLAAGVAHEINNPLSFLISNLEFVLEEIEDLPAGIPLPEELRAEILSALGTSKEGAERVAKIVRDLKSMTRVDQDTVSSIDVHPVLDSASAMLKNEIRHRARLVKEYGSPPCVLVNEARLMQVLLNLIQNAAQSIPPGQADQNQVTLTTSTSDRRETVIEVTDTGCGIPPDHLDSIFESFYTTKPEGVGTGLGLSICERLVAQMDGRIDVESTVGVGTTFRVFLPGVPTAAASAREPGPPPESSARRRVLVVDDEVEIGESVRRVLAGHHDVDAALSGRRALEMFAAHRYDVILVDVMMPEMSGQEFCTTLDARFPDHRAHLVLMSGGPLDGEARTFLEKPFSPTALRNLVANLPERS